MISSLQIRAIRKEFTAANVVRADKGERNLEMVSELNKEQKTCKNEDTVLDKIIKDIQKLRNYSCTCSDGIIDDVEDIIDKYREVDV